VNGVKRRPAAETLAEGALRLVVRDEDADDVAGLLADLLVASLDTCPLEVEVGQ
jgi:hypothetical protein